MLSLELQAACHSSRRGMDKEKLGANGIGTNSLTIVHADCLAE